MSKLHRGDEYLHYSDNSHRWIAPTEAEQSAWEAKVRAHLDEHRTNIGGPARPDPHRRRSLRSVEPMVSIRTRQPRNAVPHRPARKVADPR
jgi:hypothetical protein